MVIDTIRCFYRELGIPGQSDLINLWMERWQNEGWKTEVLGWRDAKQDPRWDAMQDKIESFPCVTGRGFESSNYERWLAFAQEDGVAADYDVFPIRPFPPRDFEDLPICGDGAGGPGFVVGRKADFSKIVEVILEYKVRPDDLWQGRPHLCDMRILRNTRPYRIQNTIATYGQVGFGDVPLAHYGNASLDEMTGFFSKMSKTEAVKILLDKHYRV